MADLQWFIAMRDELHQFALDRGFGFSKNLLLQLLAWRDQGVVCGSWDKGRVGAVRDRDWRESFPVGAGEGRRRGGGMLAGWGGGMGVIWLGGLGCHCGVKGGGCRVGEKWGVWRGALLCEEVGWACMRAPEAVGASVGGLAWDRWTAVVFDRGVIGLEGRRGVAGAHWQKSEVDMWHRGVGLRRLGRGGESYWGGRHLGITTIATVYPRVGGVSLRSEEFYGAGVDIHSHDLEACKVMRGLVWGHGWGGLGLPTGLQADTGVARECEGGLVMLNCLVDDVLDCTAVLPTGRGFCGRASAGASSLVTWEWSCARLMGTVWSAWVVFGRIGTSSGRVMGGWSAVGRRRGIARWSRRASGVVMEQGALGWERSGLIYMAVALLRVGHSDVEVAVGTVDGGGGRGRVNKVRETRDTLVGPSFLESYYKDLDCITFWEYLFVFKNLYFSDELFSVVMSSASSAVTYTSVYTDSAPGRVFWGADEEIFDGGSPRVIVYGYNGLPMQPVAPPSPDYVPGLEHPSSPDYVPGLEHPPSPIEIPYVPEPEYPEYLVPLEDEAPMEDQPLPADASPVALSPGYVPDSDLEEDPKEDFEEEHADYPANGGDGNDEPSGDDTDDDDDDDDEESFEDEEDEEEEEEHPALADSSAIPIVDPVPLAGDTEAFEADESAPTARPPQIRIPFAQTRLRSARKTVRPEPPM
ncbi:hypothetical protein Tco_1183763, partial [Tanacetum coccineum]